VLNRERVIDIARAAVSRHGWPWLGAVTVYRVRRWLLVGPWRWHVWTNADCKGGNAHIWIDDNTAAVIRTSFIPY
jgi:hypothetical protein